MLSRKRRGSMAPGIFDKQLQEEVLAITESVARRRQTLALSATSGGILNDAKVTGMVTESHQMKSKVGANLSPTVESAHHENVVQTATSSRLDAANVEIGRDKTQVQDPDPSSITSEAHAVFTGAPQSMKDSPTSQHSKPHRSGRVNGRSSIFPDSLPSGSAETNKEDEGGGQIARWKRLFRSLSDEAIDGPSDEVERSFILQQRAVFKRLQQVSPHLSKTANEEDHFLNSRTSPETFQSDDANYFKQISSEFFRQAEADLQTIAPCAPQGWQSSDWMTVCRWMDQISSSSCKNGRLEGGESPERMKDQYAAVPPAISSFTQQIDLASFDGAAEGKQFGLASSVANSARIAAGTGLLSSVRKGIFHRDVNKSEKVKQNSTKQSENDVTNDLASTFGRLGPRMSDVNSVESEDSMEDELEETVLEVLRQEGKALASPEACTTAGTGLLLNLCQFRPELFGLEDEAEDTRANREEFADQGDQSETPRSSKGDLTLGLELVLAWVNFHASFCLPVAESCLILGLENAAVGCYHTARIAIMRALCWAQMCDASIRSQEDPSNVADRLKMKHAIHTLEGFCRGCSSLLSMVSLMDVPGIKGWATQLQSFEKTPTVVISQECSQSQTNVVTEQRSQIDSFHNSTSLQPLTKQRRRRAFISSGDTRNEPNPESASERSSTNGPLKTKVDSFDSDGSRVGGIQLDRIKILKPTYNPSGSKTKHKISKTTGIRLGGLDLTHEVFANICLKLHGMQQFTSYKSAASDSKLVSACVSSVLSAEHRDVAALRALQASGHDRSTLSALTSMCLPPDRHRAAHANSFEHSEQGLHDYVHSNNLLLKQCCSNRNHVLHHDLALTEAPNEMVGVEATISRGGISAGLETASLQGACCMPWWCTGISKSLIKNLLVGPDCPPSSFTTSAERTLSSKHILAFRFFKPQSVDCLISQFGDQYFCGDSEAAQIDVEHEISKNDSFNRHAQVTTPGRQVHHHMRQWTLHHLSSLKDFDRDLPSMILSPTPTQIFVSDSPRPKLSADNKDTGANIPTNASFRSRTSEILSAGFDTWSILRPAQLPGAVLSTIDSRAQRTKGQLGPKQFSSRGYTLDGSWSTLPFAEINSQCWHGTQILSSLQAFLRHSGCMDLNASEGTKARMSKLASWRPHHWHSQLLDFGARLAISHTCFQGIESCQLLGCSCGHIRDMPTQSLSLCTRSVHRSGRSQQKVERPTKESSRFWKSVASEQPEHWTDSPFICQLGAWAILGQQNFDELRADIIQVRSLDSVWATPHSDTLATINEAVSACPWPPWKARNSDNAVHPPCIVKSSLAFVRCVCSTFQSYASAVHFVSTRENYHGLAQFAEIFLQGEDEEGEDGAKARLTCKMICANPDSHSWLLFDPWGTCLALGSLDAQVSKLPAVGRQTLGWLLGAKAKDQSVARGALVDGLRLNAKIEQRIADLASSPHVQMLDGLALFVQNLPEEVQRAVFEHKGLSYDEVRDTILREGPHRSDRASKRFADLSMVASLADADLAMEDGSEQEDIGDSEKKLLTKGKAKKANHKPFSSSAKEHQQAQVFGSSNPPEAMTNRMRDRRGGVMQITGDVVGGNAMPRY